MNIRDRMGLHDMLFKAGIVIVFIIVMFILSFNL